MKIAITITIFLFNISCSNSDSDSQNIELLNHLINSSIYDYDECREIQPIPNNSYFLKDYYSRISSELADYNIVVGGDSILDLPRYYEGFYSNHTFVFAVKGNTSCDMITQLHNVHIKNPSIVVFGSADSNAMRLGYATDEIILTYSRLIDKVRSKWPNAKMVINGLHPTKWLYKNEMKTITNAGIKDYLLSLPNTCWVDTNIAFGVNEGEFAPEGTLIDNVHPTEQYSFKIKEQMNLQCSVEL